MTAMLVMALWMFVLYYATIPKNNGGPFLNLPSETSDQKMVNITHAVVFIGLYLVSVKYVLKLATGSM
jgi:hypothetical protein